jgi:hypothetical protein
MHVQLAVSQTPTRAFLEQGILEAIPSHLRPESLVFWTYAQFPFGMSLDYQRKFSHYEAAGEDGGANGVEPSTCESAV